MTTKKPRKPRPLRIHGQLVAKVDREYGPHDPEDVWLFPTVLAASEARRLAAWLLKAAAYLESRGVRK
jgi:hypothetical protein